LQKKQDQLNSFKNSKLYSNTGVHSSKEAYGESRPVKRSLPSVKSSRSSSFNRPNIKRLTASISVPTPPPNQLYVDSTKSIEIDESEEVERLTSLKHRETLIRGMGKKKSHTHTLFKKII
jgi:hypothetical protein